MRLTLEEARELAARVVELTPAGEAEALILSSESALTRFANNHIHQNVAEHDTHVAVRAVLGKRIGVAATNRIDDTALRECCEKAVRFAAVAPEDADFPGLPLPSQLEARQSAYAATRSFDPPARARAASAMIEQSATRGLSAAGKVETHDSAVAVANSKGIDSAAEVTEVSATVLSMGPDSGSGWASFAEADSAKLAAEALGDQAATLAERSARPVDLAPGKYAVVLAPEAVADIVGMLSYAGFSAKAVHEGRSFMSGHFGEKLLSEQVTIVDDALAPTAFGLTFDYEGVPKQRVALVESGVIRQPVTDSYWAAQAGLPNTGHALPAPNSFGPLPLNLVLAPGTAAIDELLSLVTYGVYVTRFHYVNVEEPMRAVLTGMTRDGTFLIEKGRLSSPVKNLRFTQSAVDALAAVQGVGNESVCIGGELGAIWVSPLLISSFEFTGQTA